MHEIFNKTHPTLPILLCAFHNKADDIPNGFRHGHHDCVEDLVVAAKCRAWKILGGGCDIEAYSKRCAHVCGFC